MKYVALLFWSLILVACASTPASRGPSQAMDAESRKGVEFLLASATKDFRTHRPPFPARFRDVRIGYVPGPDGARQYRMCGVFEPADSGAKAEWVPFATIQTSDYEQWLGGTAEGFCRASSMVWIDGDWSSELKARLDSPR